MFFSGATNHLDPCGIVFMECPPVALDVAGWHLFGEVTLTEVRGAQRAEQPPPESLHALIAEPC
jgi:hypothetical protein